MSDESNIQALQEENTQLHALVQHQREELEQVAFLKGAMRDLRVKQALYLYRKSLGPGASFSQWCRKGAAFSCACWRCLAELDQMASPDTERMAMVDSAMADRHQLAKVQVMAADGDQQAIDALEVIQMLGSHRLKKD